MDKGNPRCLMVACTSMLRNDGYTVRVWLTLKAIIRVQAGLVESPILVSFESLRDWFRKAKIVAFENEAKQNGVKFICLPLIPKKIPFSHSINNAWCARWIRVLVHRYNIEIVHAQSHTAAGASARALKKNSDVSMVFDVHGVDIEESLADGRLREHSLAHKKRLKMQRDALARSDWILSVSRPLAAHLLNYGGDEDKVKILPCVVTDVLDKDTSEKHRAATRASLGVNDRKVVLYLGSASPWQQPELTVDLFVELKKHVEDAFLLVLSGNKDAFEEIIRKRDFSQRDYCVMSLPHAKVPPVAVAADLGVLLRESTLVNRVASPTKFAEYLSYGVPVLISNVVQDFSLIVEAQNVGLIAEEKESLQAICQKIKSFMQISLHDSPHFRERCRHVASQNLSINRFEKIFKDIYRSGTLIT